MVPPLTSTRIDGHYNANLRRSSRRKKKESGLEGKNNIGWSVRVVNVSGTKAECHEFRSRGFHDGV